MVNGDIHPRSRGEREISGDRAAVEVLERHSITTHFLLRHGSESNPNFFWISSSSSARRIDRDLSSRKNGEGRKEEEEKARKSLEMNGCYCTNFAYLSVD